VIVAVAHDALLVDDDHGAFHPQPPERAVGRSHSATDVRQQRDVERVLRDEGLMRVEVLRGDPHDGRIQRREIVGPVAVGAELFGADRRVVAGVEQQHDPLAAMVGEAERPVRARQLEIGGRLAHFRCLGHRKRQHTRPRVPLGTASLERSAVRPFRPCAPGPGSIVLAR
jgi:hypothetical protein